ncbi:MAG TPA: hypothetical protein VNY83_09890 [Solirubrobacterales bacterium]|jgi:hypothetical protein|nr:hypothetical protein [Solirubrobacterales bacterium]
MIGTYASAVLICAASLLVGRALLAFAGRDSWSWLEPAVGFGAILTVTGVLARAPGRGTTATVGLVMLIVAAALVAARRPYGGGGALRSGLPVAIVVVAVLSIPFAVSGRWGLLGEGFNNDLGLHLAWAEWLRSGFGPAPDPGYPLGPHGLAVATAAVPGIGLAQAFIGEIFAIGVLTALTALAALRDLGPMRRVLAATLVALPYLAASYFSQAAFKEMAEALFVLAFALSLRHPGRLPAGTGARLRFFLPPLALAGGIFFSYSFAGLAWPVAIAALWSLTVPELRRALAPRALLGFLRRQRRMTLAAVAALAVLAAALAVVGPFGFAHGFNQVAGSNTYGPVSPVEALGIWPASNYRLNAPGGAHLTGLAGAVAALALLAGVVWWVRRRDLTAPVALGAGVVLYLVSLPFSGDYSRAKALMIAAPLAMLLAVRPLLAELRRAPAADRLGSASPRSSPWDPLRRLAWGALAVVFIGGAAYSSFLVLRDAPVGPPGHGAELRAFLPILHGKPVLYAGQDRYAAYELLGADTHVPLVEFPDTKVAQNPEKPFDTGDAYSPIDFDSFSKGTLDRFRYVITGRSAWNSQAPPNFHRVSATPSFVLWKRTGPTPPDRHVLLEGTEAGVLADCTSPEIRILTSNPGRASLFPASPVSGAKQRWNAGSELGTGERTSQTLSLPAGRWYLSLQYFSPFGLTLSAPGFEEPLKPALDGQRPNSISLANNGQFWPAGRYLSRGDPVKFTIATAKASTLQELSGYADKAYIGELVAVPAKPHRIVPLSAACGGWIDWYESKEAP